MRQTLIEKEKGILQTLKLNYMLFDEINLTMLRLGSVLPYWHSVNPTKDETIN